MGFLMIRYDISIGRTMQEYDGVTLVTMSVVLVIIHEGIVITSVVIHLSFDSH